MTDRAIFGVVGWKNSGKTTLVERLVAEITGRGLTVSTIKHAHHAFDVDHPGKDSYRHREAGAREVLVASRHRWALMSELRGTPEPPLEELLAKLAEVDLVLVEGFKRDRHPKLEVAPGVGGAPMFPGDPSVRALAAPDPAAAAERWGTDLPIFDRDAVAAIADFILADAGLRPDGAAGGRP